MKILLGFLLALFISSHAYAQNTEECYKIVEKGKVIFSERDYKGETYTQYNALVLRLGKIYEVTIHTSYESKTSDMWCNEYIVRSLTHN